MRSTASVLRDALHPRRRDRPTPEALGLAEPMTITLTLDPAFQGLPATAHGGSVLGAFDLAAGMAASREISGLYRRRVPLGVPLRLAVEGTGADVVYHLSDDRHVLVEGRVRQCPEPARRAVVLPRGDGHTLPISSTCFACGTENPLGLRLQLTFDAETVHGRWLPLEGFRDGDTLATIAVTTLADEAAFWLAALTTGESGMTTDLRVTLRRAARAGRALTVVGRRPEVVASAEDARRCQTTVVVLDDDGVVAEAAIAFVAIRGAARRLVTGLLATNDTGTLRRVFPAYVSCT